MRSIISAVAAANGARLLGLGVLVVVALLGATGCYTKISGGGWTESAITGDGKATFGIHFDDYDGQGHFARDKGHGTYQDKDAGVSLRFYAASKDLDAAIAENFKADCAYFIAQYESLDKAHRQSGDPGGEVALRACDLGEPGFVGDTLKIDVLSGPYAHYHNEGTILGGNLQGSDEEGDPLP